MKRDAVRGCAYVNRGTMYWEQMKGQTPERAPSSWDRTQASTLEAVWGAAETEGAKEIAASTREFVINTLKGLKGVRKANLVDGSNGWSATGGEAGEPVGVYRKPGKQGFPASEALRDQRFQSKPTLSLSLSRPAYRWASSEQFEDDGGKTVHRRRDDQIELLPSTSASLASGMAGLPDENLIELLLHLKVRTRTAFPIFVPVSERCTVQWNRKPLQSRRR